jgi:hypothetical protein
MRVMIWKLKSLFEREIFVLLTDLMLIVVTIVVGKIYRIGMFNDGGEDCFLFIKLNLENFPK